uniref:protein disulfide-isomerase n=1 Tax=Nothobranchius korthausae TaxID=1143690 RepID=A0A1A8GUE9_9TELE
MSVICLLPAVSLALLSFYPVTVFSRRDVLELGDADFDYLATEHETMLVKFYAPWCGHCKKLAPEFQKAARRLKGTVQFAKVDCTAHTETCGRFGVTGYPTLKIFRYGKDSAPYDGPRTANGIYNYMMKQTGPDSVHLKSKEDLQTFVKNYDASIVGVFSDSDSSHLAEFLKAAGLLRGQFRFAHITDLQIAEEHANAESVLLFRPPRLSSTFEDSVVVFKDYLTISSLRRFIRDHIYGMCPHMTLETRDRLRVRDLLTAYYDLDYHHNVRGSNYWRNRRDGQSLGRFLEDYFAGRLKRYIKSEPLPEKNTTPVKVVVAESFDEIVNDPAKDVLIQFFSPLCPHCKKLEPVYRELADTLHSDPNIVIAKMNAVYNDIPLGYDVQGFPTIYFAPVGKKDEPIRYQGTRELKDFLKFLKSEASHGLVLTGFKDEL